MKRKATRRALVMSLLSLLLCMSMLVGTTFAWFTDSVTSGRNQIVAGNLDIELDYLTDYNNGDQVWSSVTPTVKLFDDDALWEPGHTEVAYLRVSNAGSLALKYQLAVNVYEEVTAYNMAGEEFALSQHLFFEVVEINGSMAGSYSRDAARREVLIQSGGELGLEGYGSEGKMFTATGEQAYYMLVVYMPEEVGNEANYRGDAPSISMGVTLNATQLDYEEDSFGEDYDVSAQYPASITGEKQAEEIELSIGGVTIVVPETAEAASYTLRVDSMQQTTDAAGQTTATFDISLLKNGVAVTSDGTAFQVQVYLGEHLELISVTHNGEDIADYSYTPTEGFVRFVTESFSPFGFTYQQADADTVYLPDDADAAEKLLETGIVAVDAQGNGYTTLKAAVEGGASELYLKPGADLGEVTHLNVARDLVIYGNGAYISRGERDLAIDTYQPLTDDIQVTVYNLHGVAFWGQRTTAYDANLTLHNCRDISRVFISGTTGANHIALYGCEANGDTLVGDTGVYSNARGSVILENCTFTNVECPVNLNLKDSGLQAVTVDDCTFVDCATEGTAAYYAPIRMFVSNAEGSQTLLALDNTYTYSAGKAPINGANILLNKQHNGADATGCIVANVDTKDLIRGELVVMQFEVADEAALREAVDEGGIIYLTSNITLTQTLTVSKDVVMDLSGTTLTGDVATLIHVTGGEFSLQGGTLQNIKNPTSETRYSLRLSGDAVAQIENVTIQTSGTGIHAGGNAEIEVLDATVRSFMNANGTCCFDAVCLEDNARIDAITGGEYVSQHESYYIRWWKENKSYSGVDSHPIALRSPGTSIGEISGGTFLGVMDRGNGGTPIYVNCGTIGEISGGYFGFVKTGLTNPTKLIFVNTANGGSIGAITGGSFEKGSYSTGFGCDFESIVESSGCRIAETEKTVKVKIQFSTREETYTLPVVQVVPAT